MKNLTARRLAVTGVMTALCFVSLYFKIPLPAPVGAPFLHFGNALVIIFAASYGGLYGGIAGSLGMGLFDLFNGYAYYSPKTFLLKLCMGLIAGFLYNKGERSETKAPDKLILSLGVVFLASAIFLFTKSTVLNVAIPMTLKVLTAVFGVFLIASYFVLSNKSKMLKYALLAGVLAVTFNLVGEFAFGVGYKLLEGALFETAIITSLVSLPATLVNGLASIALAIVLIPTVKDIMKKMK